MGAKILLLSLTKGAEICDAQLDELISSNVLTYLQIQVSLVAKFPYLQDLSPVTSDLREFLDEESKHYTLIFDDAHLVIHTQDGEGAIARAHTLKEALLQEYQNVVFFFSRDNVHDVKLLNKLAHVLAK